MNKAYSELDLLEEEMSGYEDNGFLEGILTALSRNRNVVLTLKIPSLSLLRAKILCEDVSLIGEYERPFTLNDLVSLLYNEFLTEVRNGEGLDQLYNRILVRTSSQPIVKTASNIFQEENKKRLGELKVKLKRNEALRGEVLLDDMTGLYPEHGFTLEELLELIILDYIYGLQLKPNRIIVNQLLNKLENV